VRMVAPQVATLLAIPSAWTPSTRGPVRGKAVLVKLKTKEDLEKQHGKLAGKIVLVGEMRDVKTHEKAELVRHTEATLHDLFLFGGGERDGSAPKDPARAREEILKGRQFHRQLAKFLADEKVVAVIEPSPRLDGGTVLVSSGGSYKKDEPLGVPSLVM